MTKIHNLKELDELERDLKTNDIIYFTTKNKIIEYEVTSRYLNSYSNSYNNSYIFNCLGLNEKEKIDLAVKCYKYKSQDFHNLAGNWPEYKYKDFSALERLIREIYKRLGDNGVEVNKEEFINSRFEILDL